MKPSSFKITSTSFFSVIGPESAGFSFSSGDLVDVPVAGGFTASSSVSSASGGDSDLDSSAAAEAVSPVDVGGSSYVCKI